MRSSRKLLSALGVAALALPAAAAAHPSAGDHPGPDNPGPPDLSGLVPDHPGQDDHPTADDHPNADDHPSGGGNAANPKVTYVFKGTYNEDGSVSVGRGNKHVRKADLVGQDVQFNLDEAKLTVADTNGDGTTDLSDVQAGDAVVVMARLPKSDPGDQPFGAKRLVDQSHSQPDDGDDSGDAPTS
jgi:hypothetical protein